MIKAKAQAWAQASRLPFYVATFIPLVTGWVLAIREGYHLQICRFTLVFLGSFMVHLSTNLVNDYFDYLTVICYSMISGENDGYVPKDSALFVRGAVLPQNQIIMGGYLDHSQIIDPDKAGEIVPFLMNLK